MSKGTLMSDDGPPDMARLSEKVQEALRVAENAQHRVHPEEETPGSIGSSIPRSYSNGSSHSNAAERPQDREAWWVGGENCTHGGADVNLSPGALKQLQIQQKLKDEASESLSGSLDDLLKSAAQTPSVAGTASVAGTDSVGGTGGPAESVDATTRRRPMALDMSFDGLGTVGCKESRICTPTKASPFPQEFSGLGGDCEPTMRQMHELQISPPVPPAYQHRPATKAPSNDRQNPKDSAMLVALARWRGLQHDTDLVTSMSGHAGGSSVRLGSTASPFHSSRRKNHEEYFDAASLHHPEGQWHGVKNEGQLSHALVTRQIVSGRDWDSVSSVSSAIGEGSSLVETERTLAEAHDHGRSSHTAKYFSFNGQRDEHDHMYGRSQRPMPWEQQSATIKTAVGIHARASPRHKMPHHHKLLSGRVKSGG